MGMNLVFNSWMCLIRLESGFSTSPSFMGHRVHQKGITLVSNLGCIYASTEPSRLVYHIAIYKMKSILNVAFENVPGNSLKTK